MHLQTSFFNLHFSIVICLSPFTGEHLCRLLVTELCNGTLDDLVKGRYNGAPIIRINWLIVRQIVVGLCYLHRNGVVHRDLNPRNVSSA